MVDPPATAARPAAPPLSDTRGAAAPLREAARCLRPDGRLVGSTIVLGTRPLDRLRVRPGAGAYGPVGTEADLRGWLTGAGMAKVALDVRGVFSYFEAQKPG